MAANEKGFQQILRSKDGVPCWDGNAATFQEYAEMASHWEQSVAQHKRYLCGPRLQAELSGTARRFVLAMKPGWISHDGGVSRLLSHLRRDLGQPQLTEMSEYMSKYFKQTRRRRHEGMNEYVTRKADVYARACQTLDRVQRRYAPTTVSRSQGSVVEPAASSTTSHAGAEEAEPDDAAYYDADEPEEHGEEDQWQGSWSWWQSGDWSHRGWEWGRWSNNERSYGSAAATPVNTWVEETVDLLPSFVQGWFLLQDAGLEAHERNMVMTALKSDFSVERVAQELRNQWPDHDLRQRDQGARGSAWAAEDVPGEDSLQDIYEPDLNGLAQSGMNDEGLMMIESAEEEVQGALALMERGRKTLKEARAKQHQVKMSRQFYRTDYRSTRPSGGSSTATGGFAGKCLKCGVVGHKVAQCPQRTQDNASSAEPREEAPFVCFSEAQDTANVVRERVTSEQAMLQGKAILDGGATRTLGSVAAVERLMELNQQRKGDTGLRHVDSEQRPVFGFGNSSSDRCLSTAWMHVEAGGRGGELKVHTLDRGSSPILFSIETLRSLGAIVDFKEDLIVFRELDPKRIIELERSCTGHQLLPLSDDWFTQSKLAQSPVPSLKDYI